jgi:hypothetical protein
VPSDSNAPKLPSDALDAFLDGILVELRDPTDPEALDEVRAAFRRRVPFRLRSYAAAAMILRAAGYARPSSRGSGAEAAAKQGGKGEQRQAKDKQPRGQAPASPKQGAKPAADRGRRQGEAPKESSQRADSPTRPRLQGEGSTIFLSMGKRQRLYPRIVIDLIVERSGLQLEEIGEVRSFDNYTFADVAPAKAQAVVSALDGYEFRGRKLSVNPAKKREGEQPAE